MSTTSNYGGTIGDPLSRTLTCETCGREPKGFHTAVTGDDCSRRDCDGGPLLTQYQRRARDRLREVPSDVCQRLANYIERTYWSPGVHEFLAPLEMTEGDIVLRYTGDAPGSCWVYWAGSPLETRFYKCISTLPHYYDYKFVGRRNASVRRIDSTLDDHVPRPVHIDDVPEPVKAVMSNDRPYPDAWGEDDE